MTSPVSGLLRVVRPALLLLGVAACTPGVPQSPEDCVDIGDVAKRDDCYAQVLPAVFRGDPVKGVSLTESAVTDQTVRDFIWLEVTRDVDPNSNKYCNRIKDPVLADRCRVLVSRPHLHRDLVDGSGKAPKTPGGGPSGPPPGAPAGGPGPGAGKGPGGPPPGFDGVAAPPAQ